MLARSSDGPTGTTTLDALPWDERIGLERAMAEGDPRHAPTVGDDGPQLTSRGVSASFGDAAELHVGEHTATLRAVSLSRGTTRTKLAAVRPTIAGAEVSAERAPGVVEWWRSLASGLEHGVTIAERPAGEGELTLDVAVSGLGVRSAGDDAVELTDARGAVVATYAHLVVTDARGARLPAHMLASADRIELAVDDGRATYPLVVDPLLLAHEATLTGNGGNFGTSVALSADGTRALVGSPGESLTPAFLFEGAARVFVRSGVGWTEEARLVAATPEGTSGFGTAVALSADGAVALIGVPRSTVGGRADAGRAFVFSRSGTSWTEQATLFPSEGADQSARFGQSVALSADGTRALIGKNAGSMGLGPPGGRVFVRSGTTWTEEAALTMTDIVAADSFGRSVALSPDGTRALVGAPEDDTTAGADAGSVRVFVRAGSTWTPEATLLALAAAPGDLFGSSLALSTDRALVGAPRDDDGTPSDTDSGRAQVFVRAGTDWTHEETLQASDRSALDFFGTSVALSDDGSRAAVGVPNDDTAGGVDAGSAHVFLRSGTEWLAQGSLLAPDGAAFDALGSAVAVAGDGSRAVTGVPADDGPSGTFSGSARVFSMRATNGTPCSPTAPGACSSGLCVDGVCCATACGGGVADCQACSVAAGGGVDGACGPLGVATAGMIVCRPSAGACDRPETCSTSSTTCPTDLPQPMGYVCRGAGTRLCDLPETCSGTSFTCPADLVADAGTVCRASAGPCDVVDQCDGVSAECADDLLPADSMCRASVGACDPFEACDGTSTACPADVLSPMGTVCGVAMGDCATPGTCNGASPMCSSTGARPMGTLCRMAISACDINDFCDGTSQVCPNVFAPATQPCDGPPSGVCDAQDHCTGTSGDCVPTFLADFECRASAGACDPGERCTGDSADCPPDDVAPSGTVCRASTAACDPAESCDGTATSCPADEACGDVDGGSGTDGGVPTSDVGTSVDAGGPPPPVAGCTCGVAPRSGLRAGLAVLLALLLSPMSRRRPWSGSPTRARR